MERVDRKRAKAVLRWLSEYLEWAASSQNVIEALNNLRNELDKNKKEIVESINACAGNGARILLNSILDLLGLEVDTNAGEGGGEGEAPRDMGEIGSGEEGESSG